MNATIRVSVFLALAAGIVAGAGVVYMVAPIGGDPEAPRAFEPESPAGALRLEPIAPVPPPESLDPLKVALGRRLFHEARLSGDGTVSCSSCHSLERAGADSRPFSVGVGGEVGQLNTPTVYNRANDFRQFWDGRAASLEEQIDGPLLDPAEMGSSWEDVLVTLREDDSYARPFEEIYGEVSPDAVRDAIATFERSLVTPGAPFDRYLLGDDDAISPDAQEGYRLFKELGCVACHQGVNVGGNMFQRFGVLGDYFADRGDIEEVDLGRYNVTGRVEDRFVFKVPSLRNVALTAPYFHDGSVETLEEAILIMARYQLGRAVSNEEVSKLAAFLETLTGELPR